MTIAISSRAILATVVSFLCVGLCYAQTNLPSAVQADLLRDQIYTEAKSNDPEAVLRSIDQYKKLGADFPTPLLWIEAKAAHDSGDAQRALNALGDFLARTDRGSQQYQAALALYPQYENDATTNAKLRTDARRSALVSRVSQVVQEMDHAIVTVDGGRLSIRDGHGRHRLRLYEAGNREASVASFRILRTCVKERRWDVYLADTGQVSWDDFAGGEGNRCISHRGGTYAKFNDAYDLSTGRYTHFPLRFTASGIQQFIVWASSRSRERWRLPSEAELELIAEKEADILGSSGIDLLVKGVPAEYRRGFDPEVVADCWHPEKVGGRPPAAPVSNWLSACETAVPTAITLTINRQEWKHDYEISVIRWQYSDDENENKEFRFRLVRE